MSQALVARTLRPIDITRDLVRTGQRVLDVRRIRLEPRHRAPQAKAALPLSAPRTSFNGSLTWRRSVALTAIGLDDVKRLKNATGTTVNDVVLAVCTGALRAFLLEGDELPDKPLVAVVPVSVRSDIDDPRGSNQVSSMFVQLPVELDDPLDRLQAIHDGTLGAKEEHEALGPDTLITWAEHATPNFFANAARFYSRMRLADRHRPIANLVISNVPGPDFPLYLGGAELEAGFPLGPVMDGMGVNITIMSYRCVLYWGIHRQPGHHPPGVEPGRRHPAGPRRAPARRRGGPGHLPVGGRRRRRPGLGHRGPRATGPPTGPAGRSPAAGGRAAGTVRATGPRPWTRRRCTPGWPGRRSGTPGS